MEQKDVVITYDTLFDLSRRERFRKELQKLDPDFYQNVAKYLTEKIAILKSQEKKDSVFSLTEADKTKTQINNAKKLIKDLYDAREAKIVQSALYHARSSSKSHELSAMLPEETEFFKKLVKILAGARKEVFKNLFEFNHQPKSLKTEEVKKEQETTVKLKCDVPEFVGPDMKTYGPFAKDQIVKLPKDITLMLTKNEHAVIEK